MNQGRILKMQSLINHTIQTYTEEAEGIRKYNQY